MTHLRQCSKCGRVGIVDVDFPAYRQNKLWCNNCYRGYLKEYRSGPDYKDIHRDAMQQYRDEHPEYREKERQYAAARRQARKEQREEAAA